MNIEEYRQFCLTLPGVTEDLPFGPDVLVFRVMGKLFSLCDITGFESVNLKCDPERSITLREQYPGIVPGYHMNKKHWNTVSMDGSVPQPLVKELVRHSYDLVAGSLPRTTREKLGISGR